MQRDLHDLIESVLDGEELSQQPDDSWLWIVDDPTLGV